MPYYIHGSDLQAIDISVLPVANSEDEINKAFKTGSYPEYLQNPDFIFGALLAQLNGNKPDPTFWVDHNPPRGFFIHGKEIPKPQEIKKRQENLFSAYPHISETVKIALQKNYSQSFGSILGVSMRPYMSRTTRIKYDKIASIDEIEETRLLSSMPEEKRANEPKPAANTWQLYSWHINNNIRLEDQELESSEFSLPGHVVTQYRITEKGNVLDYYFCSNRLLYDLSTQTKVAITKERIEEAEAEEAFNLAVYFPLKIALRELSSSPQAEKLRDLLKEVDAQLAAPLNLIGKRSPKLEAVPLADRPFIELPQNLTEQKKETAKQTFEQLIRTFQPRFEKAMGELSSISKEEKLEKDTYIKMQADDRCMLLAVVREKLVQQLDQPMAAILNKIAAHLASASDEDRAALGGVQKKLQTIQEKPYYKYYNEVLLQMSNPVFYDEWVTQYIKELKDTQDSPEFSDTRLGIIHQAMDVMIELARLQQLAHQSPYSDSNKKLQEYIDKMHYLWKASDLDSDLDDNQKRSIKNDLHNFANITSKFPNPEELIKTFNNKIDEYRHTLLQLKANKAREIELKEAQASTVATSVEPQISPPTPEKKSWGWLVLSGALLVAALAINFIPIIGQAASTLFAVELAAEHLLYMGMGFAAVGGAIATQWWQENKETFLRIIGVLSLVIAVGINVIPGVGQALSGVFSYIGFSLLNITLGVSAGMSLFGWVRSKLTSEPVVGAPVADVNTPIAVPVAEPVAVPVPVESIVVHHQRPKTLYELPGAEEKAVVPRITIHDLRPIEIPQPSPSPSQGSSPSTPSSPDVASITEMKAQSSSSDDSPPASPVVKKIASASTRTPRYVNNPHIHFNDADTNQSASAQMKNSDDPQPAAASQLT